MARILLAEDDPILRLAMTEALAAAGHVVVAPEAGEALRGALERAPFDLVLTDLKMPGMDGWAVADWVQAHRPGTAVIAISGFVPYLPREQLAPFAAILQKPIRDARLLGAVEQALARRAP